MASNTAETFIGALVLAAAGGFIYYAAQTANMAGLSDSYTVEARFRAADGVSAGTDVRMSGVKVGRVNSVFLDPMTYEAIVSLSLNSSYQLPEDSDARIQSETLLGGNYLSLTPGSSDFMIGDGGSILNTQGSVSLLDLLISFGVGNSNG